MCVRVSRHFFSLLCSPFLPLFFGFEPFQKRNVYYCIEKVKIGDRNRKAGERDEEEKRSSKGNYRKKKEESRK